MTVLTQTELQNIGHVGGIALECTTLDELRDELFRQIQDTLEATSGVYTRFDRAAGDHGRFRTGFWRGVPDGALDRWCEEYQEVDPFVRAFLGHIRSGGERVVISSHVVDRRDYVRSAFYCDFLKPQAVHHVLVAGLVRNGQPTGILGLHRPAGARPFEGGDVLKMSLILPHLSAALEKVGLVEKLAARQSIIDTLARDLARSAVLMVDEHFGILLANESATALLRLPAGGNAGASALPEGILKACTELRADVAAGRRPVGDCRRRFTATIDGIPMTGVAQANCNDPRALRYIVYFGPEGRRPLHPERLAALGLSGREAEIVHLVSFGLTNLQIGARLGISVRTVENHLRSIFAKVNVHNRTSLLLRVSMEQ